MCICKVMLLITGILAIVCIYLSYKSKKDIEKEI